LTLLALRLLLHDIFILIYDLCFITPDLTSNSGARMILGR